MLPFDDVCVRVRLFFFFFEFIYRLSPSRRPTNTCIVAGCCWLSWMDCPLEQIQVISQRGIIVCKNCLPSMRLNPPPYPPPTIKMKFSIYFEVSIRLYRRVFLDNLFNFILDSMILSSSSRRTRMNSCTSIWKDGNLWSSCEDLVH